MPSRGWRPARLEAPTRIELVEWLFLPLEPKIRRYAEHFGGRRAPD
jgi:hypothetical protein